MSRTFQSLIDEGVLEIGDGYRAKNSELGGSGPLFLRAGHLDDTRIDFEGVDRFQRPVDTTLRAKMSQPGDTVITTKGNSTGRTAFVTPDMPEFVYSPHLSYWRSRRPARLVAGFLRYWAKGEEFRAQLRGMAGSTDMAPYLSLSDQRRLVITLPDPRDQRAIAAVLGSLDDKIDLNRRMNATLDATARAIFKAWFVDFEALPVEAARREPVAMVAEGAAAYGGGHRPHWPTGTVGDLCVLRREVVDPREHPLEAFAHFSIPAFDEGRTPHVQSGSAIKSIKFAVPTGSVLISKLNPRIPRIWRPDTTGAHRAIASTEFLVLKPRVPADESFMYALLGSTIVQEEFSRRVSGTSGSHQRVHADDLLNIEVPLPPTPVRSAFGQVAGPTLSAQQVLLRESQTLSALRNTLLPKLLSGEVRVKDIG